MKDKIDFWTRPATIERNRFKYKSLSCWSYNIAVGCEHGCTFCYVPEVSTRKLGAKLKDYGVQDPDGEWGEYLLLRPWDQYAFERSLREAENMPAAELNSDGNRAVMACTTTDPYQAIRHKDATRRKELQFHAENLMSQFLGTVACNSTLNVRILTRSPMARQDFGLMRDIGKRLLFGMSLPTLDNRLSKVYEPHAPSPSKRLETLQLAKEAGLNVYVAVAPTYPECDSEDLNRTFAAIKHLDPVTVFHEPINIRADNIGRIKRNAEAEGVTLRSQVFNSKESWVEYQNITFYQVEELAKAHGLYNRLHLWPDASLKGWIDQKWLDQWWNRISEWPC